MRKWLKKLITTLIVLYVMIGAALYFFQERIMFLPTKLDQDYEYTFDSNFEELFFETEKNTSINAIHFKAENPKGVILYFHGNAGDLSRWGKISEYFVGLNYDVLIMDYRTYGKSKGKLSEAAIYKDAQYCYDYILERYSEEKIIIYGRSLGTGIASYIASKNKANHLILETPYYSIEDVAKHRFPIFPLKKLLRYKFPTYQYLPEVNCDITIIHGTDDDLVPYKSGKKLSELNIDNLNFVTVQNGKHNNLIDFETYRETIKTILK